MGRACKCKICGTKLNTDNAYSISMKNINNYYCNKEEYDNMNYELDKKKICFNTIIEILNIPFVIPVLAKEIQKLNEFYDYIVIEKTFKSCENDIKWALENKNFSSEYGQNKYIMTIIRNSINTINNKYKKEQSDMLKLFGNHEDDKIEIDIMNNTENKSEIKDISEFLE